MASMSGRLITLGLGGARFSRQCAFRSHPRLISSFALQSTRTPLSRVDISRFSQPSSTRNFWWSSASKTTAATATAPEPAKEASAEGVSTIPGETVPDTSIVDTVSAVNVPVPDASSIVDASANAISNLPPPPLSIGDFTALGLGGWGPIGLCQYFIEAFHVTSGLPWVWTIIGATVASRLLLLPFQLKQMKNTAKMAPHTADIAKLREDMNQARLGGDQMAMQRAMLQQKVLYEKMGVSMSGMMLPTFIQIPVTLGMFFAVKGICELPVPQLTMSGLEWLPDLTAADPTYILPVVLTAAMNFQLTIGMRDMAASPAVPHMVNAFRVLSIVGMFWMFNLPSGVLVYLLTSLTSMTAQSLLLRIPVVRAKLGIPPINVKDLPKSVSLKESVMALKRWWTEEKSRANELAARKRRRL